MREILFRAKRADTLNNSWVYGSLVQCKDGHTEIMTDEENETMAKITVIRDTVGQFTGLYDKNGKKIFEGDILKVNNGCKENPHYENRLVEYRTPYFAGFVYNKGEYSDWRHEVIGNIHDNPKWQEEE